MKCYLCNKEEGIIELPVKTGGPGGRVKVSRKVKVCSSCIPKDKPLNIYEDRDGGRIGKSSMSHNFERAYHSKISKKKRSSRPSEVISASLGYEVV